MNDQFYFEGMKSDSTIFIPIMKCINVWTFLNSFSICILNVFGVGILIYSISHLKVLYYIGFSFGA